MRWDALSTVSKMTKSHFRELMAGNASHFIAEQPKWRLSQQLVCMGRMRICNKVLYGNYGSNCHDEMRPWKQSSVIIVVWHFCLKMPKRTRYVLMMSSTLLEEWDIVLFLMTILRAMEHWIASAWQNRILKAHIRPFDLWLNLFSVTAMRQLLLTRIRYQIRLSSILCQWDIRFDRSLKNYWGYGNLAVADPSDALEKRPWPILRTLRAAHLSGTLIGVKRNEKGTPNVDESLFSVSIRWWFPVVVVPTLFFAQFWNY